jgi:hypothetical protein
VRWLAETLRLGILRAGCIHPQEQRAVRDMARWRMLVSQQATRTLMELTEAFPEAVPLETAADLLELLREQRRIAQALAKKVLVQAKLDGARV